MSSIRVAVVGVGNCAASLVQGVHYYRDADPDSAVPGLMHVQFGDYHVRDVEFVAAFDVDAKKVGSDLSDASAAAKTTYLPVSLASVAVSFDGGGMSLPGHLHFVSPGQINVQIPWEFQGQSSVKMKVNLYDGFGFWSDVYTVPLAQYSPGSFGVVDTTGALVAGSNAAKRGATILVFANGLGPVNNQPASGEAASSTQLSPCASNPTVTIGGATAAVQFCGLAPGFVGLYQLNLTVPATAPTGTQPLIISNGSATTTVTIPVQ